MFYQIFLSPQVKRWAIMGYKHGIYELTHELPNWKLCQYLTENFWKIEIKLFPLCATSRETRVSLKYLCELLSTTSNV